MVSADDLIAASADTNLAWESMLTRDLAEEILEQTITADEWVDMRDALDDGVYEIVMAFKK
jgi:hypothetical protein